VELVTLISDGKIYHKPYFSATSFSRIDFILREGLFIKVNSLLVAAYGAVFVKKWNLVLGSDVWETAMRVWHI